MAQSAIRPGYEMDSSWQLSLKEIEPKVYPCHYSENAEFFKNTEKSLRMLLGSKRHLDDLRKVSSP